MAIQKRFFSRPAARVAPTAHSSCAILSGLAERGDRVSLAAATARSDVGSDPHLLDVTGGALQQSEYPFGHVVPGADGLMKDDGAEPMAVGIR